MSYVVTEACINCKYTECVDACPVDCFYEGPNMLVIDPRECVDCGMCVSACPVAAIVPENRVPADQLEFIAFNASMAGTVWPNIVKSKDPMPDAAHWARIQQKHHALVRPSGDTGASLGGNNPRSR